MHENNLIILFDGVCNLCNGTVDFLLKHDHKKQFRFVPLQSQTGKMLFQKYHIPIDGNSVVFIKFNQVFFESDAIIEIAGLLGYPWKMAYIGKIIPNKIRNRLYRIISKNRYRWFGKRKHCRILSSDDF